MASPPPHIVRRNRDEETQATVFETRQKMVVAANLRKQGHGYPHIAQVIGCSRSYAEKLVRKAIREIIKDDIEDLIKIELDRLDALFLPAFYMATELDAKGNPIFNKEASDAALKIMERRARLLGLDRPIKTEISGDLNVSNQVQIYIPDNGRGLPANSTIENGLVVAIAKPILDIDLDIDTGDNDDLADLLYDDGDHNDLYADEPNIERI